MAQLVGAASLWLVACRSGHYVAPDNTDAGPCGRGKARACQCDDGERGIAQCLVGGDWGDCYCSEYDDEELDGGARVDTGLGDGALGDPLDRPKANIPCDQPFDVRAHAASGLADPYLIHGANVPGMTAPDQSVCFYFKPSYPADAQAVAFVSLQDEVSHPDFWVLYGVDATNHADGDIVPCNSAETAAYPLAGFSPGSDDLALPMEYGLALPAATGGLILEVHYSDQGAVELLDRTGVRICTAASDARARTLGVHFAGSEDICVPPGAIDFEVSGVCSPRTDEGDIHMLSVWPRVLQLGARMQVQVKRSNGSVESLFDEPVISTLQTHHLPAEVLLSPGDTVETHCFYDNPNLLPVAFGSEAADALCYAFINAWPVDALALPPPFNPFAPATPSNRCITSPGLFAGCL